MTAKDPIAKPPRTRVRRTTVGTRQVLSVEGKDPNYVYRVVNDTGSRIDTLMERGYELVDAADVKVGDARVGRSTPTGTTAEVNVGGGMKAQVMRIRKEYYDEDQADKQALNDKMEQAMRETAKRDGLEGDIKLSRGS